MSIKSDPSDTRRPKTPLDEEGRTDTDPEKVVTERALQLSKPGVGDRGLTESRAGIRLRTPVPPQ